LHDGVNYIFWKAAKRWLTMLLVESQWIECLLSGFQLVKRSV